MAYVRLVMAVVLAGFVIASAGVAHGQTPTDTPTATVTSTPVPTFTPTITVTPVPLFTAAQGDALLAREDQVVELLWLGVALLSVIWLSHLLGFLRR